MTVRDVQTCSPRFGRPGTGRAAAGLHFGLRASVLAPQYEKSGPSTRQYPPSRVVHIPDDGRFKKDSRTIRRARNVRAGVRAWSSKAKKAGVRTAISSSWPTAALRSFINGWGGEAASTGEARKTRKRAVSWAGAGGAGVYVRIGYVEAETG